MTEKSSVLIVEDDGILAMYLEELLQRRGYTVLKPVATAEKAVQAAKTQQPALVIMDIELHGAVNGIAAAEQIQALGNVPLIFLTSYSQDSLLQQAMLTGPYGYLVKPISEAELTATIEVALYKHQFDRQVRQSEARYRALVEQAADAILLADQNGTLLEVNSAGCVLFGAPREVVLQRSLCEFITPNNLFENLLPLPALQEGQTLRGEGWVNCRNGQRRPVEISAKLLEDGCIQAIIRDISDRKKAEQQAKRTESRLRSLQAILHYEAEDPQDLLDYTLRVAIDLTQSKIGYIYHYDETKQEFILNTWSKGVMEECAVMRQKDVYQLAKTGLWGEVIQQRQPIIINDFKSQNPLRTGYPSGNVPLTRFLSIPVFGDEQILAVVGVANKESDYEETDQLQLSLLMDSVWKIFERKRTTETLRIQSQALNAAANAIIITDQLGTIQWINRAFAEMTGYTFEEVLGKNPRDLVRSGSHDRAFYQEMWTTILNGEVWHGEMVNQRKDGLKYIEEMTITPLRDPTGEIVQFIAIKQDITARKQAEELLRQTTEELKVAYEATLQGWSNALEMRERETAGHSQRVVRLTLELAQALGVGEEELVHIQRGALLHDIGKLGVPDNILLKPESLSVEEWAIMRQHPIYAHQLLSKIPYLLPALDIPYSHHERWDGTGYPLGLSGEEIPLAARIFSIVDVWDALLSNRPYRPAWRKIDVIRYLKEQSGKQFDPHLVETFLRLVTRRGW